MQTKVVFIAHVRVDAPAGTTLYNERAVQAARSAVTFKVADAYVETDFAENTKIVAVIPATEPTWETD